MSHLCLLCDHIHTEFSLIMTLNGLGSVRDVVGDVLAKVGMRKCVLWKENRVVWTTYRRKTPFK